MWKRAFGVGGTAILRCSPAGRRLSSAAPDPVLIPLLRSLEEHRLELSEISPPPKVKPPPPSFSVVEGAMEQQGGPVLRRAYGEEEITVWVDRRAHIIPSGAGDAATGDVISELCLFVDVSKPWRELSLLFLCGLYPDGVGIHSICLKPSRSPASTSMYQGRVFQELDRKMRDAFQQYIETRGVNKSLFPFLQAWLYMKDYQNLMSWFQNVGTFIKECEPI